MKDKKPLYIFIHTPKCAGTTIRHTLLENYGENEVLLLYKWFNSKAESKKKLDPYFNSLSKKQRDKIKAIIGHNLYYGIHKYFPNREVRYVTFLRKPFDRTISHYNFQVSMFNQGMDKGNHRKFIFRGNKLLPIKDWFIKNQVFHNLIFKFLFGRFFPTDSFLLIENYGFNENDLTIRNLKKIKKMLDKFYFIGITENQGDFLFIYHQLGLKKVRYRENISRNYLSKKEIKDVKKLFLKELRFDQEIYDYAKKLNKKFKKKHKEFYPIVYYMKIKKFIYSNLKLPELYKQTSKKIQQTIQLPFKISAKLKKKSKKYTKFVKFIKRF